MLRRERGTILASCKARGLSFTSASSIGDEETIKDFAESFVVRLSIRLVRSRHLHFRARAGVLGRRLNREMLCSRSPLLLPTFETSSWHLLCWRPVDDHLRTTMTTTRKEDCLQSCIGGGRGEHKKRSHTDSRSESETRRYHSSSLFFGSILFA